MSRSLRAHSPTLLASASAAALLWISRTLLGLLVAFPILLAVRGSGMASGPGGDAVLFRPGSRLLLETLRLGAPLLGAGLRSALLCFSFVAIAELLPLAAILELLWLRELDLVARLSRTGRLFWRFLSLGVIVLLLQGALLLGASLLGAALKTAFAGHDERWSDLSTIVALALGVLGCGAVGCVLDLARAEIVVSNTGSREALARALLCLRHRPFAVLLGAYSSVAAAAFGYVCAAWLVNRLELTGASTLPIALSFVAHQAAVLFAIGFRVRWLSRALELCARAQARATSALR